MIKLRAVFKYSHWTLSRNLVLALVLLNLLVLSGITGFLLESRRLSVLKAEDSARNLSILLEHTLADTFQRIDIALQSSADLYLHEESEGHLGNERFAREMTRQALMLAIVCRYEAFDQNGQPVPGSYRLVEEAASPAEPHLLARLREDAQAGLVISRPIYCPSSGELGLAVARRLETVDHSFAGMVAAAIPLNHFKSQFGKLHLGPKGSIAFRDGSLRLIVRHPMKDDAALQVGATRIADDFTAALKENPSEGVYLAGPTSIDGVRRLHSYRYNKQYDFYINAGFAMEDFLKEWEGNLRVGGLLMVAFASVSCLFGWIFSSTLTQLRQSDEALLEKTELLHTTGEIAKIGGWSLDVVNGDLKWTREVYAIHEVEEDYLPTVEKAIGFYSPESLPVITEAVDRAVRLGESFDHELEVITFLRNRRFVRALGRAVFKDGAVVKVFGSFQDITERKQAEDELRHTRFCIDRASDAIFWIRSDARVADVNNAACLSLGYSREEMLHLSVPDIDVHFNKEKWPGHMAELRAQGSLRFESEHRCRDGRIFPVEIVVNYVQHGSDERVCAFVRDITARKQAEDELRESESILLFSQKCAHLGSWRLDFASNVVVWSEELYRMYGFDPSLPPPPYTEHKKLFTPQSWELLSSAIARTKESGTPYEFELEMIRGDRSRGWLWVRGEAVRNSKGLVTGIMGAAQDITERKHLEECLRQSDKLAAVGQLAGGIAHNFNNQLTGVIGYADLLLSKLDDEKHRRYAAGILSASRRAADLTAQLLAFARKGKYLEMPVDIHHIIGETVSLLQQSIDKRIEIRQHFNSRDATVLGDSTQLQNMFLNLSLNARDAMPEGGVLIFETALVPTAPAPGGTINSGQHTERKLNISVIDSGVGMSPETMAHLFEPFFTTKEFGQGTGLGLASVLGTAETHHGTVAVTSEPGKGTTFTVTLPLHETGESFRSGAGLEEAELSLHSARVLLVDDEEVLLVVGDEILRDLGCRVTTCRDGQEAVAVYQRCWEEIDLVILDVVMPRMGGRETFAALTAINPGVKVIITSGYTINGEAREILNDGALSFLQKPFNQAELSRKMGEVLKEKA